MKYVDFSPSSLGQDSLLEGMQCPNEACEGSGPFEIECTTMAHVTSYEAEATDLEWDDESECICSQCSHVATVKDFRKGE